MNYSHYVVFPSAKPSRADACVDAWKAKGYKTLVYLDTPEQKCNADIVSYGAGGAFPGYYKVIGSLARQAFAHGADVVTCIGDDMMPPEQGAEWVAADYFLRFPNGLGVYQGCGDPQGKDEKGTPAAARICGSPTFGIEWSNRAYEGRGAFHDGFRSFYADELLKLTAHRLGLLWMEPAVNIFHAHWSFGHMQIQKYHQRNQLAWDYDRVLFESIVKDGFPGCSLL